ncbi:MAG: hypothetical protein RXQ76_07075 [Acidianus sp.]
MRSKDEDARESVLSNLVLKKPMFAIIGLDNKRSSRNIFLTLSTLPI